MTTRNLLSIFTFFLFFTLACQAQKQESHSEERNAPISFLNYVNGEYVDILATTVERSENTYEISLPYYEFPISKIDVGEACMFAVSRDLSREWEEKAITTPKGDCDIEDDYLPSFYVTCEAARLITKDTTALLDKFDLYSFLIKKSDLAGPFNETSESGGSEYYDVKENSTIIIYEYKEGKWREVGKDTNSKTPRVFGEAYMENLVYEKAQSF